MSQEWGEGIPLSVLKAGGLRSPVQTPGKDLNFFKKLFFN